MFFSTEITYSTEGLESLYSELGVKIHGAIMKLIPAEYASELHQNKYQPFSLMCLENAETDEVRIRVSVLDENAAVICERLTSQREIFLYGAKKPLLMKEYSCSVPKSAYSLLLAPVPKGYRIDFLTPATYKHGGKGVCTPELYRYFRSAAEKLMLFERLELDTEKLMSYISRFVINNYSLSGQKYNVSGNIHCGMPGFAEVIFTDREKVIAREVNALLLYSEYCGIGAKTAVGMGGIRLVAL